MTNAPENIWAITEPDDVSADILGDVYAQQVPDGMNGTPIKYIREDVAQAMVAKAVEGLQQLVIEYDGVDLAYDEPKSMTAAYVVALDTLAELTGGKKDGTV